MKFLIFLLPILFQFSSCSKIKKTKAASFKKLEIGDKVDSLNGVYVYYNNKVSNVSGRNLAPDGYNLGLKYQCVEFVKRYYYEHYNHKMPDSYGHAKDFYETGLADGTFVKRRNLYQYSNPGKTKPKEGDLLVYGSTAFNKYGHVAIVSKVTKNEIEIIQQNPGAFSPSRETYRLKNRNGEWKIDHGNIKGWLRK